MPEYALIHVHVHMYESRMFAVRTAGRVSHVCCYVSTCACHPNMVVTLVEMMFYVATCTYMLLLTAFGSSCTLDYMYLHVHVHEL